MNDKMFFDFTHSSEDGNWTFNKNYDYGTQWSTVLTDFLNFLSGIYGYSIHNKVEYLGNPATTYTFEDSEECESW